MSDREHRAIIGFSMGGFMSFYLAGKYPGKITAAVNMVGSQDFFVGYPDDMTLYQMRYTFDNLRDVSLLFHNRTNCPMSGLNDEVNEGALWSEMKDYEYHKLEGNHQIDDPGETRVFESALHFVSDRFNHPMTRENRWTHYDLYPEFNVWGYSVKSEKKQPGFLCLTDVDKSGFGFYTRKWLPDGPAFHAGTTTIITAPIYSAGKEYVIQRYSVPGKKNEKFTSKADDNGRLHLNLGIEDCEIGIASVPENPGLSAIGYRLGHDLKYLRVNEPGELSFEIFNRSGYSDPSKKLSIRLSCNDSAVNIMTPVQNLAVPQNEAVILTKPFRILCSKVPPADGAPAWLRMKVEMNYDTSRTESVLVIPLFYDVSLFENIQVDDGRVVGGTHIQSDFKNMAVDSVYGSGNADGLVAPGESVMLYEKDHRLRLFTDDPYVMTRDEIRITEFLPAKWPDGFTISSVVKISEDCPAGHEIEFLAHYETKSFMPMYRNVTWGKVRIRVNPIP